MQKGWLLAFIVLFIIVFSSSVYPKLSDSEKLRLEMCPIGSYIKPYGNDLISYTCYDINLRPNASKIVINVTCDRFTVYPGFSKDNRNELHLSATPIGRKEYLLKDFRFNKNYFEVVGCFINRTKLNDPPLWVNLNSIKPTTEEIITEHGNRLTSLENKSTNKDKTNQDQTERIGEIEEKQKSQDCKDNIELLTWAIGFLIVFLSVIIRRNIKEVFTPKFWNLLSKSKFFWISVIIATVIIFIIKINLLNIQLIICKSMPFL